MRTARRDSDGQLNPFWPARNKVVEHSPGVYSEEFTPEEMAELLGNSTQEEIERMDNELNRPPRFRSWALRANDWAEGLLDSINWRSWDILAGNVCGVAVTGVVLYLAFVVIDAWLQGRFNLGGQ